MTLEPVMQNNFLNKYYWEVTIEKKIVYENIWNNKKMLNNLKELIWLKRDFRSVWLKNRNVSTFQAWSPKKTWAQLFKSMENWKSYQPIVLVHTTNLTYVLMISLNLRATHSITIVQTTFGYLVYWVILHFLK